VQITAAPSVHAARVAMRASLIGTSNDPGPSRLAAYFFFGT
jgi:hypothetical protein